MFVLAARSGGTDTAAHAGGGWSRGWLPEAFGFLATLGCGVIVALRGMTAGRTGWLTVWVWSGKFERLPPAGSGRVVGDARPLFENSTACHGSRCHFGSSCVLCCCRVVVVWGVWWVGFGRRLVASAFLGWVWLKDGQIISGSRA